MARLPVLFMSTSHLAAYTAIRPRLLRLAYRHLGCRSEAEDVVQEAWLRLAGAEGVASPEAYLVRVVTRLCIDLRKSARARRETYVGQWLPEPVADLPSTDPVEARLDLSFAMMRAYEALSPEERAALFLHDLFDLPFAEIGETLERTPAAVRQLASRARQALSTGRQRVSAPATALARLESAFRHGAETGDVGPLTALLAADVRLTSDGGGKVSALPQPLSGAEAVARLLLGLARRPALRLVPLPFNDAPGYLVYEGDRLDTAIALAWNEDGTLAAIDFQRNPDKLAALQA